jgi:nucleoside-diphosphate-sugar epimerase
MRIFLAGATGVIGRRLVPQLTGAGHQVTGLVRRPGDAAWLRDLGAAAAVGDVFDRDGVLRAVRLAAPDVVMHQLTDLKSGNFEANSEMRVTGTRHLMDAALAAGVRRVVAQSIAWVYEAGDAPATEGVPLDLGAYGSRLRTVQGVAALETAVREAPEWVALRYGLLYGPGTWYARDGLMAERAARGELAADADVSSFVHVDDAAGAAADALEWPTGAVNVCDDVPAAGREWVPVFCRAVGAPDPAVALEPAVAPTAERHGWARGASNEYARKGLNWTPAYPSWREGFAALWMWR